jgi:hypothetical protein
MSQYYNRNVKNLVLYSGLSSFNNLYNYTLVDYLLLYPLYRQYLPYKPKCYSIIYNILVYTKGIACKGDILSL